MRKFVGYLNTVLWALTLAALIKMIIKQGPLHITLDIRHPRGTLGWLFTISIVVTIINYFYYHLINPKVK